MLAHWFNRSGIGQLLAPDENAPKPDETEEAMSGLLQLLAPDPKFAPPKPPPRDVQCQHCHKWTPANEDDVEADAPGRTMPANLRTPAQRSSSTSRHFTSTPFWTPSPQRHSFSSKVLSPELEQYVLSAAKLTAEATFSPPPLQKQRDKVFRACATTKMDDRLAKRLRSLITKDPSLLHGRATHLGDLAPDGLTPLQTAAYAGSLQATEIILELGESIDSIQLQALLMETDMKGRTALHVAAERGQVDIVLKLLPLYQLGPAQAANKTTSVGALSSPMPVDLLGRTPFGIAITSPNPTARKNKKELGQALFSSNDLSIFGVGRPEMERVGHDDALRATYGTADMPGRRVIMEDALCACRFQINHQAYLLLGICDGHGDQGLVSDFVATTVPRVLQEQLNCVADSTPDWSTIWTTTCLQVDQQLKDKGDVGGSTAVFVLITEDLLVTANVGDSRIILVQNVITVGLESAVEQLSLSEGDNTASDEPLKIATSSTAVLPLSEDHKPNLPREHARVEAAGMHVVEISFEEDGKTITIPKVQKSDSEMLAVSRAFGDFEYKGNTMLGPEEQAVVCLPEVRVHRRSHADQFLILACDGIWDVCSNDKVKDFVIDQVKIRKSISETVLPEVGDALLRESLNLGSQDNMSAILVALGDAAEAFRPPGKTLDFDDA